MATKTQQPKPQPQDRPFDPSHQLAAHTRDTSVGLPTPFSVMRRLFDDFASLAMPSVPRIDITKRDGNIFVQADLPGMAPDDITVRVEDDTLVLEGERHVERDIREDDIWTAERSYGHFRRVVHLPPGIDAESAQARFENGVLEIKLRAPDQAKRGRTIEINRDESDKSKTSH